MSVYHGQIGRFPDENPPEYADPSSERLYAAKLDDLEACGEVFYIADAEFARDDLGIELMSGKIMLYRETSSDIEVAPCFLDSRPVLGGIVASETWGEKIKAEAYAKAEESSDWEEL